MLGARIKELRKEFGLSQVDLAQRMEAMKAGGTAVESESYAVDESDGLYIDSYYLPTGGEKTNLIVLTTGVHGMEGYIGAVMLDSLNAD